ncbi:alkaline phosphatase family protein [Alkalihalobacillus sp. MEB130]|uniref:alkaline phosphatase family protein n=1 Tax=Alkalihalobacillus sp. MEB130 TaxID=2976704 RepID=UPI0028E0361D|nr:alkaline phosphatase family protein [Alkalihalobacillus sp. MEB130]MDT8860088.1 alkaline phosphatase family protein [Alkalihalobacillus sp. MEB130]
MMRTLLIYALLACMLVGCQQERPEGATLAQSSDRGTVEQNKNVIVVVIDSMTKAVVEAGMDRGALPALSFLAERGQVYHDLVAPFPSMSVAIESTLVTGASPRQHKVPGLVWYDPDGDVIVDYGSTLSKYWKLGINDTLMNTLVHLNTNHLSSEVSTIYEDLKEKGRTSGSVNLLVYRGDKTHRLTVPSYMKSLLHLPDKMETKGPDLLAFGQAVKPKALQGASLDESMYQKFGLNDSYSSKVTRKLIQKNEQPDFLMVFFPNYDKDAHYHGPVSPEYFAKTDGYLQDILGAYDSWDEALEENIFVIMGDHGQDRLSNKKEEAAIELEPLLEPYNVAPLMDEPSSGDIVIANNHRSAYLYATAPDLQFIDIAEKLSHDARIDHVAWLDGEDLILFQVGEEDYLRIREGGNWRDPYGQTWSIDGNEKIADIKRNDEDSLISYGDYPDIFHQLYSALYSHSETMIVTAKPGYTLKSEGAPVHNEGGEHGGLHKNDTITSMIVAGTDQKLDDRRMEALKEYFLELFK